jgi:hypothetical protein
MRRYKATCAYLLAYRSVSVLAAMTMTQKLKITNRARIPKSLQRFEKERFKLAKTT